MARTGKITLYEGIGKDSNKPFQALKLQVGEWDALYFPKSRFEMEYIKAYLNVSTEDNNFDLTTEDEGTIF